MANGWWCPTCEAQIPGKAVSYSENCTLCGTYLGDCQPPDNPVFEAAEDIIDWMRGYGRTNKPRRGRNDTRIPNKLIDALSEALTKAKGGSLK